MLRHFLYFSLCALIVPASAQFRNEAAISELVQEIVRKISAEYSCELLVLWTINPPSHDRHVVRMHADGPDCETALVEAADLGEAFDIRFATLADIGNDHPHDSSTLDGSERESSMAAPRIERNDMPEPPFTYDLLDDRIESVP